MSFNYQPNYMQLIKALQSGGIEGASQAKQARATREPEANLRPT